MTLVRQQNCKTSRLCTGHKKAGHQSSHIRRILRRRLRTYSLVWCSWGHGFKSCPWCLGHISIFTEISVDHHLSNGVRALSNILSREQADLLSEIIKQIWGILKYNVADPLASNNIFPLVSLSMPCTPSFNVADPLFSNIFPYISVYLMYSFLQCFHQACFFITVLCLSMWPRYFTSFISFSSSLFSQSL